MVAATLAQALRATFVTERAVLVASNEAVVSQVVSDTDAIRKRFVNILIYNILIKYPL